MAKKHCCSVEFSVADRFCSQCGKELASVYEGTCEFKYEADLPHDELMRKYHISPEQIQIYRNKLGRIFLTYDFKTETFTHINGNPIVIHPKPSTPPIPEANPNDDPTTRNGPRESYMKPPALRKQEEEARIAKYEKERQERQKKAQN